MPREGRKEGLELPHRAVRHVRRSHGTPHANATAASAHRRMHHPASVCARSPINNHASRAARGTWRPFPPPCVEAARPRATLVPNPTKRPQNGYAGCLASATAHDTITLVVVDSQPLGVVGSSPLGVVGSPPLSVVSSLPLGVIGALFPASAAAAAVARRRRPAAVAATSRTRHAHLCVLRCPSSETVRRRPRPQPGVVQKQNGVNKKRRWKRKKT